MSEGFHPEKSRVNGDALADFIRAQLTGNLEEVPGIGPATVRVLKEHEITTTYQLIGKYLSLKGEGVEPVEHADRFYFWLKNITGIVHSIAEKVNSTFVGLYDADAYQS